MREHFSGKHGCSARVARLKEAGDAVLPVLGDAAADAAVGDAEGTDDVALFAGTLTDELGGEHAKGRAIAFGMDKDRGDAAEVGPAWTLFDDADALTDGSSPVGNEW